VLRLDRDTGSSILGDVGVKAPAKVTLGARMYSQLVALFCLE
jgi:hypothetical protein